MKRILVVNFAIFFVWVFMLGNTKLFSQDIQYNDQVSEEELRKREAESTKEASPTAADPYYEKYLKNEWERNQEKKAQEIIEELRKEYGTDKFNKEALDKGPVKHERDESWPPLYKTPPADPYYEKEMKNSWQKEEEKTKRAILKALRNEIEGEQSQTESAEESSASPPSDTYYDKEIKKSWEKERKDLIERVKRKLKEEKAIVTVEEEKKLEEEKKAKEEEKKKQKK